MQAYRLDDGTCGVVMTGPAAPFPLWAWFVFGAGLLACLAVDLILHRGARLRSHSAAITWTGLFIACIGATIWPSVRALRRLRREARQLPPHHPDARTAS